MKELIAHAKANPGKLNWGFGRNAGPHLLGELFVLATGIDVNRVPYRSGADAVPDMLGGRVQMNFGTIEGLSQLVQEGKLRALVVTGETRSPTLPDVPTMKEAGFPHLTRGFWAGLLAPAGTPADIVTRLNTEINATLATSEMKSSLMKVGVEPKVDRRKILQLSSRTKSRLGKPPRNLPASCRSNRASCCFALATTRLDGESEE